MESDYYEYKSTKGLLSLRRNKDCPNNWDLCFNGHLIHSNFNDPYQAALHASKADFGIEWLDSHFSKVYVPSDIRQWRKSIGIYTNSSEKLINN
jgi:hypothetical protein